MTAARHLDYPRGCPPDELGPAALDDLLDRGDLADWAPLARSIRADPFGSLADTVLRLCAAHPMYGTSAMWTTWIERLRSEPQRLTLRQLRKSSGLTQTQVAERLESSQSDVSKLERRNDVRLSTLRAYVEALGGTLDVTIETETLRATLDVEGHDS